MLAQIILSLETLPADFATEGQLWTLMGALMDHQVVGLRKPALAILAYELAFLTQFASEVPGVIFVDLHHGEHFVRSMMMRRAGLAC